MFQTKVVEKIEIHLCILCSITFSPQSVSFMTLCGKYDRAEFYVLLTVNIITVFINNQVYAQFFCLYLFIPILYVFPATKCSSSGESIVSIRPQVYVGDRVECR